MKTIEEQLSEATAKVTSLEADVKAGSDLLVESNAKVEAAEKSVADIRAELDGANATLETVKGEAKIESDARASEIETLKADLAAKATEIETLKADAKTAEQISAERYGAGNTPVGVTGNDAKADEGKSLLVKFNAISDSAEQTTFWQGLTAAQKNAVLRANAESKGA